VLFADDYGYHYGSVWYSGRFTATGSETSLKLNAITGRRGNYLVWLDGHYLGSAAGGTQADSDSGNRDPGPGDFSIPAGLLDPGRPATFAVLVQNMGHNDDWTADDNRMRQPRGLVGAALAGSDAPLTWRIQGARGGEDLVDRTRGPLNNGGLYGERNGWSLPDYPDEAWPSAGIGGRSVPAGVTWFRTTVDLDLPTGQDTSVALRFGDQPSAGYRLVFFLNGWNLGQYGGDVGPQTDFVLPAGLLREGGRNTLAVAVVATEPSQLTPVRLVSAGTVRGGVRVAEVPSPGFGALFR
jgi:hypothetical protein